MTLPELSIKRHVFAFMLSGVLLLLGIISYQRIGVDRFPRIEFPVISISTAMQGANPDIVDSSITNIIENKVNSIPGIEHIQSQSSPGISVVNITFNLDKDVDVAFNEVQAKINQVLNHLPTDADSPQVQKVETESSPIMWLALQGDRTQQQLNQYAINTISKQLVTIDGVGEVRLGGRRNRTIRVELIPSKMTAYGVTVRDVTDAFGKEHLMLPGGFLVGDKTEDQIKLDLEYHSPEKLGEMIVLHRGNAPIRLKEVAEIDDALSDFRQFARFNSTPSVGIGIVKIANTNTVKIIEEVKRRLDKDIIPQLPPGMTLKVASDTSVFILELVNSLLEHLVLGTLLAGLVVLFFLKNFRSTVIITLAIPVSLLGAVAVIYFAGFTFNTLTLLAMLLLIGVVVDDAIVVLENIYRHREKIDPDAVSSAIEGTNQVVFAVMASTMTLVSIFAPVIFLGGIIGKFFQSFAVVVTFGVLVSWFVSMTLTPMLCSRYLNVEKKHGKLYLRLDEWFHRLELFYRRSLEFALHYRFKVILVTLAIFFGSFYFFATIGKGFVPEEDEGSFMLFIKAPLGTNINYSNDRLKEVEKVLSTHKEIASYFAAIGLGQAGQVNKGIAYIRMAPKGERDVSQQECISQLRVELARIPGIMAFPAPVPIVGGQRGEPLQFVVTGQSLSGVDNYSRQIRTKLMEYPEIGRLDLDLQLDLPQKKLEIDRTRAADAGLSSAEIAQAVNIAMGGVDIAKFNDEPGDGERYDIRLKFKDELLKQMKDVNEIYIRTRDGELVRLDTVAHLRDILGPAVITRFDLQYSGTFYGSPTIPLGKAIETVQKVADEVLPLGYQVKFIGEAEEMGKTARNVSFAFALAMILVYMVLASQFNSFLQPMVVMLAQPLAIIGGITLLWMSGHTLNIYSMIGFVLLVGLVAKNSILLVDITNQYRTQGYTIDEALKEACPVRLRPVLMTSATIIFALLPTALGMGAGAGSNAPLAVAVIGGMVSSTLLTFIVVPSVYSLVENGILFWKEKGSKEALLHLRSLLVSTVSQLPEHAGKLKKLRKRRKP